jgi:hypothetical protein
MADGAPLETNDPIGVIYLVMITDEDGRNPTPGPVFLGQDEAKKYTGPDTRMTIIPKLTFATAKAAKAYSQGEARRRVMAKLSAAEQVILFGKVE